MDRGEDMEVNYIREINAFYNELEIKPLSSSAISLWYALLHLNNRCGWKDSFSVPVGTLSLKSGLSDRTIVNARNELKTKDYLTFQSREGNRSAIYQLKRLYANFADNLSDNSSYNVSCNLSDNSSDNVSALFKHKPKQKLLSPTTTSAGENNIFIAFENEGFGTISDIIGQKLGDLADTYSERWVFEAMKQAVISGKRNLNYVHAILRRWQAEGIDSPWERSKNDARSRTTLSRSHSETELYSL